MQISEFPKITVIIRGYHYEQIEKVAEVLSESNNKYGIEVTLNTDDAFESINKLKSDYPNLVIGAGTVLKFSQAKEAIKAGAEYILSPTILSKEVLNLCHEKGVIIVPGGFTPTEIKELFDRGADIVKVFPASTLGAKYFTDIQAPLGKLPLMAVGGINKKNARNFLLGGASFLGIGSGMFNKEDILNCNKDNMRQSLSDFEKSIL